MTFKFGSQPARALKSFGVSGVLGNEAKVFYDNLFSTKHIGRVSDLIAARLQAAGADELKLRSLLLFGFFEGYRARLSKDQWVKATSDVIDSPMIIECGIDREKIAVGFAFSLSEGLIPQLAGLEERLKTGASGAPFEDLILSLIGQSDRTVIRYQTGTRKLEIIGLIAIPGKIPDIEVAQGQKLTWVEIEDVAEQTPEPDSYIELGDLDYPKLLREDERVKSDKHAQRDSAETFKKDEATEDSKNVSGDDLEEDSETEVKGEKAEEDDTETLIKGTEEEDDTEVRIAKDKEPEEEEEVVFSSKPSLAEEKEYSIKGEMSPAIKQRILAYEEKIQILQARVAELEAQKNIVHTKTMMVQTFDTNPAQLIVPESGGVSELESALKKNLDEMSDESTQPDIETPEEEEEELAVESSAEAAAEEEEEEEEDTDEGEESEEDDDDEEEEVKPKKKKGGFTLGKLFGFGKKKAEKSEEDEEDEDEEGEGDDDSESKEPSVVASSEGPEEEKSEEDKEAAASPPVDAKLAAQSLLLEIEAGGMDRALAKAKEGEVLLKKEAKSPRVKAWVDGMLEDLVQQKSKLQEMAKKINRGVRQKELEFKNKERAYQEEIKRRDELAKQKDFALARAKDQMAQLSMNMERLKSGAQSAATEMQYRKRFEHIQKLLVTTQEKNMELTKKVEDMRSTMVSTQSKTDNKAAVEMVNLQKKMDKAQRQLDEYKQTSQKFSDQVKQLEEENSQNRDRMDEMKTMMKQAVGIANAGKAEVARLKKLLEDAETEKMKANRELNQLKRDAGDKKAG